MGLRGNLDGTCEPIVLQRVVHIRKHTPMYRIPLFVVHRKYSQMECMEGIESRLDWFSMDQIAFHNELIGLNPRVWNNGKFSSWGYIVGRFSFTFGLSLSLTSQIFKHIVIYTRIWHMHYTAYIHTYIHTPTHTHAHVIYIFSTQACTMKSRVWVWRKETHLYLNW